MISQKQPIGNDKIDDIEGTLMHDPIFTELTILQMPFAN